MRGNFFRDHKVEIAVFILALLVRALYLGVSIQATGGDYVAAVQGADGYYNISQNLIHGNGFSGESEAPYTLNSFRPPLQPYFLAYTYDVFGNYWLTIVLLLLMGSAVPVLAMLIARFVVNKRSIILATGIILALEPSSILFSTLFYSETLFMFFLLLSVYYLFKYVRDEVWYHGAIAAALLGLATLTRAVTVYLPIILVPLFFIHFRKELSKKRVYAAAGFIGIFLLVLSPWVYRNYHEFHTAGVTSEEGVTLYTVLIPSMFAVEHGTTFQQEYDQWTKGGVKGPNTATIDLNAAYVRQAIPILLQHPFPLLLLSVNTAFSFFTHDGVFDVLRHIDVRADRLLGKPAVFLLFTDPLKFLGFIAYYATTPLIFILIMRLFWILATVLYFIGVFYALFQQRFTFYTMVSLGTVLYFALMTLTIGLTVNARYRLPVEFLIIPFALYGLSCLYNLWHRRSQ